MPNETIPLRGFSPSEAVWHLLKLRKGYGNTFQTFKEVCLVNSSPESMLLSLEQEGVQARIAFLQAEDLSYLELPTLLQLKDGSWVILERLERKGLLVETMQGKEHVSLIHLMAVLNGQALDLSPSIPQGKTLLAGLMWILGCQRGALIRITLATLMAQCLALAIPEITGVIINIALPDGARSMLKLLAAGVLVVATFQAWTGWIRERTLLYLVTRLEVSAERSFLDHVLRLPFPFLQKKTLGEMLQAFGGLTAARELLTERVLGALFDGTLAVIYLVVMASKLMAPTMVVALVAVAMTSLSLVVSRPQARQQELEVEAQAKEQGYLAELITGIGTMKAAGAEHLGLHRWLDSFWKELSFNLKKNRLGLWSEVGLITLQQGMTMLLLVWGANSTMKGELRIGTLFAFMLLASGFLGAVSGVVNAYRMLVVLRPQVAKAQEILEVNQEIRLAKTGGEAQTFSGDIWMKDVYFRYTPSAPWILKGYNLKVECGECISLVGPSGFGKSTILRLIAGLYEPEEGSIHIGGFSPQAVRNQILYLPQFVRLRGGAIIDNLRALSGEASVECITEAAQHTGLHDLISRLPMGYYTLLPQEGKTLSGGQRQLIALTAALASGRSIILLDEAFANLDNNWATYINQLFTKASVTVVLTHH